MRKWLAVASSSVVLASLLACSDGEDGSSSPNEPADAANVLAMPRDGAVASGSDAASDGAAAAGADASLRDAGVMPGNRPGSDATTSAGKADAARPGLRDAAIAPSGMDSGVSSTRMDSGSQPTLDSGATSPVGSGNPAFPPLTSGCNGYATRYWDCCKPHCGWTANVSGATALATCSQADESLGSNFGAQSSCQNGTAFMCQSLAPWAVNPKLAFGFAAIAARGDICGKCYQLQFSGSSKNGGNDPGSAALAGKTMVVQATNVGGDVGSGQFDVLIPGGGVGMYNSCSTQWGVPASELGAQYGGFLTKCKQDMGGGNHAALKSCVMQRCSSVFGARGLSALEAGCRWFVEWYEAADNPALIYKEIACPDELKRRGMNRNTSANSACGV